MIQSRDTEGGFGPGLVPDGGCRLRCRKGESGSEHYLWGRELGGGESGQEETEGQGEHGGKGLRALWGQ